MDKKTEVRDIVTCQGPLLVSEASWLGMLVLQPGRFPGSTSGKELTCQCTGLKRHRFESWVGKIFWSRKWPHDSVFLPGKFHGQRNLVGYSAWGPKELNMTGQNSGI